jgi:hypothetical protein
LLKRPGTFQELSKFAGARFAAEEFISTVIEPRRRAVGFFLDDHSSQQLRRAVNAVNAVKTLFSLASCFQLQYGKNGGSDGPRRKRGFSLHSLHRRRRLSK